MIAGVVRAIESGCSTVKEIVRYAFGTIENVISELDVVKDLFEEKAQSAYDAIKKKRRP